MGAPSTVEDLWFLLTAQRKSWEEERDFLRDKIAQERKAREEQILTLQATVRALEDELHSTNGRVQAMERRLPAARSQRPFRYSRDELLSLRYDFTEPPDYAIASEIALQHDSEHKAQKKGKGKGKGKAKTGSGSSGTGKGKHKGGKGRKGKQQAPMQLASVEPLARTEDRWMPASSRRSATEEHSMATFKRKVQGFLNKLTVEKFGTVSSKLLRYVEEYGDLGHEHTAAVVQLVVQKAALEPVFSPMYADLCVHLHKSTKVDEEDAKREDKGKVTLVSFRRHLLERLQEMFERADMGDGGDDDNTATQEAEDVGDALERRQKARDAMLGTVQFIGELFKTGLLGGQIMLGCIKMLLKTDEQTDAGDSPKVSGITIEALCQLLTTIGKRMDDKGMTGAWSECFLTVKQVRTSPSLLPPPLPPLCSQRDN